MNKPKGAWAIPSQSLFTAQSDGKITYSGDRRFTGTITAGVGLKTRVRFYNNGLPCGNPGNIRKYMDSYGFSASRGQIRSHPYD